MNADMINFGKRLATMDVTSQPNFKCLELLAEQFRMHKLPIKCIGKIHINVSESFFDDESEAKTFISNIGTFLSNVYKALCDEFGDDAATIFSDHVSTFKIAYRPFF